jgi:site-specific recombinase XerD
LRIKEARQKYRRWLLTRDLSTHTTRAYDGDIGRFERHVGPLTEVDDIDRDCLILFLEMQRQEGLSTASLRRRAAALRGFFRWMLSENIVTEDPWIGAAITFGRSHSLPRFLPAHELKRLLDFLKTMAGPEMWAGNVESIRARPHEGTTLVAIALMLATGVRVHEVVGIKCRDIDIPGQTIRLLGKGRRERRVYLTNDWITCLAMSYLEARDALQPTHPYLLFNLRYEPLTTAAMRSRLTKVASAAGLSNRVTPHMLRHTAATQLIEAGVDIRYIQRLLGHASLSTTEIYTHVSDAALRRVVSDADVLGRFA